MRLFRLLPWGPLLLAIALAATGCTSSTSPPTPSEQPGTKDPFGPPPAGEPVSPAPAPPADPPAAVEWKREEIPFDYEAMKEEVRVQLDEEPQLHSPLRTVVGAGPQAYTFFFREPMDRSSVEAAIRLHTMDVSSPYRVQPALDFHWVHDRQLHVLATLAKMPDADWIGAEYVLNAGGAKTAKGKEISGELAFQAVAMVPSQVWQVSLDGMQKRQLSSFSAPYFVSAALDDDRRFLLMYRYKEFCECDAPHIPLYAVYDTEDKTFVRYPVQLVVNYRGKGEFVADRRGFFYTEPGDRTEMPPSKWAVPVNVKGFVHGASFSRDRRYVLMAVGSAEQKKNLDLVIYDLDTGEERRLQGAVKGTIPISEADGATLPVQFADDGRYATFMMRENNEDMVEVRQLYDWRLGRVVKWSPPVARDAWSGYVQSDDGAYQMYWNAGLYHGETKIKDSVASGVWIPGTHLLAYLQWEKGQQETSSVETLRILDADKREERVILGGLRSGLTHLVAASRDGKWLLLQSEQDLGN